MKIVMLFLDGVGIGARDPSVNPLFAAPMKTLRSILDGELPSLRNRICIAARATATPLDATLGVPGLPQSGTGQTALFTGANGAKIAGRHFGPYPYSTLKPIIRERNVFRRVKEGGKAPCFANAFPQRFFDYVEHGRGRMTVTTMASLSSDLPLRRATDLEAGRGVSADITGEGWRTLGYPAMPIVPPQEAGRRLVRLLENHDFVLFEYWQTDHAGHARSREEAVSVLEKFDGLLEGIVETIDSSRTLVLITSDHGNIENLATKTHTRNPVPLIVYGDGHREFVARHAKGRKEKPDLTIVTPAIMDALFGAPRS